MTVPWAPGEYSVNYGVLGPQISYNYATNAWGSPPLPPPPPNLPPPPPPGRNPSIPPDATYFPEARWGGNCKLCGRDINVGDAFWWYKKPKSKGAASLFCGFHQSVPITTTTESDDMAKRQDFTFKYTGAEIADALEARATEKEEAADKATALDEATLLVLFPSEADRTAKRQIAEISAKSFREQAEMLRKEAKPYRKAAEEEFDIDTDDIAHFGL